AFCARDCEFLFVEQVPDAHHHLDVFAPVDSLPRPILLRSQHRKLSFPVTKHVGLDLYEITHLPDPEAQLLRDFRSGLHSSSWSSTGKSNRPHRAIRPEHQRSTSRDFDCSTCYGITPSPLPARHYLDSPEADNPNAFTTLQSLLDQLEQ